MSFPRYPKYKDSGVPWLGEVPEHWVAKKFGAISSLKGRLGWQGLKADEYRDQGPFVVSSAHFTGHAIQWDECPRVSRERYDTDYNIQLAVNDLLLMKDGAAMGKLAFVDRLPGPACLNSHLLLFRPVKCDGADAYSPRFAFYFMQTEYFQEHIKVHGTGATFLGISQHAIARYQLLLPPVSEQALVAAFLDRETAKIDALVEEQRRLMELLKEKRQAVISHAVTKGLNPDAAMKPSGIEWLGQIPAHWEVQRLKNIAARLQGRLIVQPQLYFADEGVPIVFGYNIKDGTIDEAGLSRIDYETDRKHAHAKARAGDLFTVRLGDPGKTVVVPKSLDGCHFASIMWIHQDQRFHSAWLSHCMNSAVVQRQIEAVNYGAAQTQFNIRDAVDFRLPVPPLEEQREIVAAVDRQLAEIDTLTAEAQRAIDLLQERRTALISAAVTGQIDVRGLVASEAA